MAITYNYKTNKIESDRHLKKVDSICRVDDKSTLIGDMCMGCPHCSGIEDGYVLCKYHTSDDKGALDTRYKLYDEAWENAFRALDYM